MRRQQAECQKHALSLALRECRDARTCNFFQTQWTSQSCACLGSARVEFFKESEHPVNRLLSPGEDSVRQVKQCVFATIQRKLVTAISHFARVAWQQTGKTLEHRSLARAIRPNQPEHFSTAHLEADVGQHTSTSKRFSQPVYTQHLCFLCLKLVAVAKGHATSRAIDAPTDPAIRLIEDILEIHKQLRPLRKLNRATNTDKPITRQVRKQRHWRVVIHNANAVNRRANRQQTILHLRESFPSRSQNSTGIATTTGGNSREPTHACAAAEEVLNVSSRTRRACSAV